MHQQVWKGVESDDNESYISTGTGGFDSDIDEDEDDLDEFGDFGGDKILDEEAKAAAKAARKAAKKAAKKDQMRSIREEIQSLNEQLNIGGGGEGNTPQLGEELADFYARTSVYWEVTASKTIANGDEELSVKELKREGFKLAKELYEELKPVLDRLQELDEMQEEKESRKAKKASKKEKKSKDRRK